MTSPLTETKKRQNNSFSERTFNSYGFPRFTQPHFTRAAVLTRFTVNNASTPTQSISATRARTLYLDRPSVTRAA